MTNTKREREVEKYKKSCEKEIDGDRQKARQEVFRERRHLHDI